MTTGQTRGTKLKCGTKDLQEGSGKANSLKKGREKERNHRNAYFESSLSHRKYLRKESSEILASKPGQSSWSKEGEMLPGLEGRISTLLFVQHNLHCLFNISLCLLGLQETSFPGSASLLALLETDFPPPPNSLL